MSFAVFIKIGYSRSDLKKSSRIIKEVLSCVQKATYKPKRAQTVHEYVANFLVKTVLIQTWR